MKSNKRLFVSILVILALSVGAGYTIMQLQDRDSEIAESPEDDRFQYDSEEQKELAESEENSDKEESNFEGTDSSGGIVDEPYEGNESADGVSSDSGNITLQSPGPGQTIGSGDRISGLAEADAVQYRIVDYERGVIAQGQMEVSNGTFSGSLSNFSPSGELGALEVYTFDEVTGTEKNRIEIEVGFRQ